MTPRDDHPSLDNHPSVEKELTTRCPSGGVQDHVMRNVGSLFYFVEADWSVPEVGFIPRDSLAGMVFNSPSLRTILVNFSNILMVPTWGHFGTTQLLRPASMILVNGALRHNFVVHGHYLVSHWLYNVLTCAIHVFMGTSFPAPTFPTAQFLVQGRLQGHYLRQENICR
jgi:hypothetical protein